MANQSVAYDNTCGDPLALCKTSNKEQFWLDDPTELYKHFTHFIPQYEMTRNQQLNAVTRFCVYMIIIILLFNRGEYILVLPISILIIIVLFKKFHTSDFYGKDKELNKVLKIRKDKEDYQKMLRKKEYDHDADPHLKTYKEMDAEIEGRKDYILETGIIDSNDVMNIGPKTTPSNALRGDRTSTLYTVDEMIDYRKNTCRKPTPDNPFMNPATVEFNNGDPPAACNANDDEIKENIKTNFNHNLFTNVDELWERANSQRQFYTMPNTSVPNQQTEFAQFLYSRVPVCKDNQENCLRYDDVRYRIR